MDTGDAAPTACSEGGQGQGTGTKVTHLRVSSLLEDEMEAALAPNPDGRSSDPSPKMPRSPEAFMPPAPLSAADAQLLLRRAAEPSEPPQPPWVPPPTLVAGGRTSSAGHQALKRRGRPSYTAPDMLGTLAGLLQVGSAGRLQVSLEVQDGRSASTGMAWACSDATPIGSMLVHTPTGSKVRPRPARIADTLASTSDAAALWAKDSRGIRSVDDFASFYQLTGTVMPSIHKHVQIRYATATAAELPPEAGHEVVVKVLQKRAAFRCSGAEKAWRASMERLLGFPACSSIAQIYEVLEDSRAYYVVMEKAGGRDLYMITQAEVRMHVEEAKEVLRQLLHAVRELHLRGCVHRDIKLENVMLERMQRRTRSESCNTASSCVTNTSSCVTVESPRSIADVSPSSRGPWGGASCGMPAAVSYTSSAPCLWGTAGCTLPSSTGASKPAVKLIDFDTVQQWRPQMPKAADVVGTDQYIAPEAYDGWYSPASDVFAVGVVAFKLLTKAFPFRPHIFDDKPGENWVGSPRMRKIRKRLCEEQVDWCHPVFINERGGLHLISRMLAMNDRLRPTAEEALRDDWLAP